jgi:hypothetical protein
MTTLPITTPFVVTKKDLSNGNELFIIDIEEINNNLRALIDAKFVKICEGNSGTDLAIVKSRLLQFLKTKKGSNLDWFYFRILSPSFP